MLPLAAVVVAPSAIVMTLAWTSMVPVVSVPVVATSPVAAWLNVALARRLTCPPPADSAAFSARSPLAACRRTFPVPEVLTASLTVSVPLLPVSTRLPALARPIWPCTVPTVTAFSSVRYKPPVPACAAKVATLVSMWLTPLPMPVPATSFRPVALMSMSLSPSASWSMRLPAVAISTASPALTMSIWIASSDWLATAPLVPTRLTAIAAVWPRIRSLVSARYKPPAPTLALNVVTVVSIRSAPSPKPVPALIFNSSAATLTLSVPLLKASLIAVPERLTSPVVESPPSASIVVAA